MTGNWKIITYMHTVLEWKIKSCVCHVFELTVYVPKYLSFSTIAQFVCYWQTLIFHRASQSQHDVSKKRILKKKDIKFLHKQSNENNPLKKNFRCSQTCDNQYFPKFFTLHYILVGHNINDLYMYMYMYLDI